MSKAIDQKKNHEGFVKPGELVEMRASADLSLQDRRVFNLLIDHAWSEIGQDKVHKLALAKLRGARHKGSERVRESIKALMVTLVEIRAILDGESAVFTTQLLGETTQTIDEDSPNAVLLYSFPKGLRRAIQDSRYWGRIKAHVMFAFSSKYALMLYEALCLRANLRVNEQTFSVEDFRALLGVESGAYPQFPQFKQKVVTPALLEINSLSDFNAEVEPIREGGMQRGALIGFRLSWEKKTAEQWHAVLDELMRPRVGRAVRLGLTDAGER